MAAILGRSPRPGSRALAVVLMVALFPTFSGAEDSRAPSHAAPTGDVRIEAQHLHRLVLVDEKGRHSEFYAPGATLQLPVGRYHVQEVELLGGVRTLVREVPPAVGKSRWITVRRDETCRLRIPPLEPRVTVRRQGRVVRFDFQLVDTEGQGYVGPRDAANAPRLTVYRGDREIHTGTFEYG